jgi:hypothetical protein
MKHALLANPSLGGQKLFEGKLLEECAICAKEA